MTRAARMSLLVMAASLSVLASGVAVSAGASVPVAARPAPTPTGPAPTATPGCAPSQLKVGRPECGQGARGYDGHIYSLEVRGGSAGYIYIVCLTTTTTINKYRLGTERSCSGRKGAGHGTFTLTVEYNPGDQVWLDFEHITGVGSTTDDDIDITGATWCNITGTVHNAKVHCRRPSSTPFVFSLPPKVPYAAEGPSSRVMTLLNLMAWCVSAAAVIGLLLTGTGLALQVRRGVAGEVNDYVRPLAIIAGACLLATSAGPIVDFLDLF